MKFTEKTDEWDKYRQEHPCRYLIFWWTFGGLFVSGFLLLFVLISSLLLDIFNVISSTIIIPTQEWNNFGELIFNMFQVNFYTFLLGLVIAFWYEEKPSK